MTDISNEEYPKKTRCRKTQATGTDENLLKHIARLHRAMFHNGGPLPHFHISAFILYQFQTSPQPVRKSGLILIHIQCMLESARVMIPSVWRMPSGRKCNLRNKWTMMIGWLVDWLTYMIFDPFQPPFSFRSVWLPQIQEKKTPFMIITMYSLYLHRFFHSKLEGDVGQQKFLFLFPNYYPSLEVCICSFQARAVRSHRSVCSRTVRPYRFSGGERPLRVLPKKNKQ